MFVKIFLKFEGGRPLVRGASTDPKHDEWIDATSAQLGDSKPQRGTKSTIHEVQVTRQVDPASPDLWLNSTQGNAFTSVTIEFFATDAHGEMRLLLDVVLDDVVIESMSTHGAGAGDATESFVLAFKAAKFTEQHADSDDISTQSVRASWDGLTYSVE